MTKFDKTERFKKIKPKQKKLVEKLCDPENKMSIKELCDDCGISRQTFYNWQSNEDFREYVNYVIDLYTDSELANVWKALIKKAVNGDVSAQKLYMELKNKYKQQVNLDGGVVIISGEDEILD